MTRSKASKRALWDGESKVADTLLDNAAAPSNQSSISKLKWARRGLFVMAFIATPLTFLIWVNAALTPTVPVKPPASASSIASNSSQGKAPAIAAVTTWLAGIPSPLPGGMLVSWDGFETLPAAPSAKDGSSQYSTEIHYFTLSTESDDSTLYFRSSVEVLVDPILGAKVAGDPTLLPVAPSNTGSWPSQTTWPGFTSSQPPKSVSDAVDAWATAFTSGKPDALRLAVGDPDPNHSYMPLTGATASQITITDSAGIPLPDPKATAKQMLVRVTLQIAWTVTVDTTQNLPTVTYDLLVNEADTASPRVVSWGGAGSAPSLQAYSTSVKNKQIQGEAPIQQPSDLPTGMPTQDSELGHD